MNTYFKATIICFLLLNLPVEAQVKQQSIPRVDLMADVPKPFGIIDYNKLAKDFDAVVYDFDAKGEFWPLVWIDKSQKNHPQDVVGLYTAMG
ncbi:MAG: hypothetical protein EOO46_18065, partial [Flavobacterium sp.]